MASVSTSERPKFIQATWNWKRKPEYSLSKSVKNKTACRNGKEMEEVFGNHFTGIQKLDARNQKQ